MTATLNETQPSTVAFYTLGCRANQLESSAIADEFKMHGWQVVPYSQPASLYIINTCTVTEGADSESRRIIRKAKRTNPNGRIAVTGCYVQVAADAVAGIDGVNYVIGNNFKQDIYAITQQIPPTQAPIVHIAEIDKSRILAGATTSGIDRTRASLKIQDGCDFKCTYCIIWVARGPSRSLSVPDLTQQFAQLVQQGHHEIVLTGINIGQYECPHSQADLATLLQALVNVPGVFRIRLSSLDPAEVTPTLLKVMADNPERICPYLHLSMQNAQDDVLKRMARRHKVRDLLDVMEAIQAHLPGCAITADIITGFPGETAERFEQTYNTLRTMPLSGLHVFTFSKREGTPAATFENQVDEREKKQRTRRLIALADEKHLQYRQAMVGQSVHVVVEESQTKGMSEHFVSIQLNQSCPQGALVPVTITQVTSQHTLGQVRE